MPQAPSQHQVVVQEWTEYERGWGQRPDGVSVHLSDMHRVAFIDGYNATFNNKPSAPDEYSVAQGQPYVGLISAIEFDRLRAAGVATDHDYEWRKFGIFLSSRPVKVAELTGARAP